MHGLARLNKTRDVRLRVFGHEMADRDNNDEKRQRRKQINLPGIVTARAEFPAHR
jgi:hypothetical protein